MIASDRYLYFYHNQSTAQNLYLGFAAKSFSWGVGKWGMGRWGNGEMGKWGCGEKKAEYYLLNTDP
ncbi:MAG: hypothetical protein EWV40_13320 [Microcystis flos-aquae Mf_WU_F_19750830_S460]|uniref:Uncharacterized protein n=1 Tax=Microcystis flos-aquae Mf_WU_F_19750830_S460 TaxID=2486237 RepID=A0A552LJU5_9CHRO|nr:MAG: hypothetical protein EWV40_13320 [Microcystis flos-aquae Mf_WU_F_19750830_S460]